MKVNRLKFLQRMIPNGPKRDIKRTVSLSEETECLLKVAAEEMGCALTATFLHAVLVSGLEVVSGKEVK